MLDTLPIQELETSKSLVIHVVTYNASDYPGKWVVRRWFVSSVRIPEEMCRVYDSLEEARRPLYEADLVCLARHSSDDPVIVETWL